MPEKHERLMRQSVSDSDYLLADLFHQLVATNFVASAGQPANSRVKKIVKNASLRSAI